MALLLLLNGLPGSGKSTVAAAFVARRPLSLRLDVDVVRELLGAWEDRTSEAGHLARRLALVMAREVLRDGRDVVVPQLLAEAPFVEQLEALAEECGAAFGEVLLRLEPAAALDRLAARRAGPTTPEQRSAHRLLDRAGGAAEVIPPLHGRLADLARRRPRTAVVDPVADDVEATLDLVLNSLRGAS